MDAPQTKPVELKLGTSTIHHEPGTLLKLLRLQAASAGRQPTCAVTGKPVPQREPYLQLDSPRPAGSPAAAATPAGSQPASSVGRRTRNRVVVLGLTASAGAVRSALEAEGLEVPDLAGWTSLPQPQQARVQQLLGASGQVASDPESEEQQEAEEEEEGEEEKKQEDKEVEQEEGSSADVRIVRGGKRGAKQGAKSGGDGGEEEQLSEFERARQAQIAKNRSFMASLALPDLANKVTESNKALKAQKRPARSQEKGIGGKKRSQPDSKEDAPPPRQSLRARKIDPDPILASGVESEKNGVVALAAKTGIRSIWTTGKEAPGGAPGTAPGFVPGAPQPQPQARKERHPSGPLPFEIDNGSVTTDKAVLEFLRTRLLGPTVDPRAARAAVRGTAEEDTHMAGAGGGSGGGRVVTVDNAAQLKLQARDVAKMTTKGTTHLTWHPSPGALLLAAGDKEGRLALWQVDHEAGGGGDDDDGFDGVSVFTHVHRQYVSAMAWVCDPGAAAATTSTNHLLSTSYDGSIRVLDVQQGVFLDYSKGVRSGMEISALDLDAASGVAYVGDNQGMLEVVDLRAGRPLRQGVTLHDKRINCLHLEPLSRRLLLSSGSDALVKVWDVRKLRAAGKHGGALPAPLWKVDHSNSCHAAYWAPNGSQRVLTTSYDDTVRVWLPATDNTPAPAPWGAAPAAPVPCAAPPASPNDEDLSLAARKQLMQQQQRAVQAAAASAGAAGGGLEAGGDVFEDGPLVARAKLDEGVRIKHDNQTGRWVTPFRAIWGAASDIVMVGNMTRGVDIFEASTGRKVAVLQDDLMTAIPSRLSAHPCCPVLAAATSSGRVHIWR